MANPLKAKLKVHCLKTVPASHGISHLTTQPHTPEHNGVAEWKHQYIVETASHSCWLIQDVLDICYNLINRLLTPVLHMASPYKHILARI